MPTLSKPYAAPVAILPIHYDKDFPLMFGGRGAWQVYTHAAVQQVLFDYENFGNGYMPQGPDYLIGSNLNQTDPPLHPKLRSLIAAPFSKSAIVQLEGSIQALSVQLLSAHLGNGRMDFAVDLAFPLSASVIGSIIGIPQEDYQLVNDWARAVVSAGYQDGGLDRADMAQQQMFAYFAGLLSQRQSNPRQDLLSSLAHAALDNEPLPLPVKVATLMTLLLAGYETTASLLISAVHALCELPGWQVQLRDDSDLTLSFIWEVLRLRPALASMYRIAKNAVNLEGQAIKEGELINAWISTANLDPQVFKDPEQFNPYRDESAKILSFGYGLHHCVGDQLAKAEARILLTTLLSRVRNIGITPGAALQPAPGIIVSRLDTLPITFNLL